MSQPRNNPFLGDPNSNPQDVSASATTTASRTASVMTMITTQAPTATAIGSGARVPTSSSALPLGAWVAIGVTGGLFVLILGLFVARFVTKRRHKQVDYEGGQMRTMHAPMPRPHLSTMDAQTLMRVKPGPELPQVYLPTEDMQRMGSAVAWRPPSMSLPQQALLHRSHSTPTGSVVSLPRSAGGFGKQAAMTGRKPPPGPIVTNPMSPARASVYGTTNVAHGLNSVLKTRSSITGELLLVNNGVTTSATRPSPTWQPVARSSMLSVVDNASDLSPSPTMQRRATVDAFIRAQQASVSDSDTSLKRPLSTSPAASLQPSVHSDRRSSTSLNADAIPRLSTPFQQRDDDDSQHSPDLDDFDHDHLDTYIPDRALSPAVQYPEVWFRPSPAPVLRPDQKAKPSGLRQQQDVFLLDEDDDTSEEETG